MQIDELTSRFPEPVRRRGAESHLAGSVILTHASKREIRAMVRGTEARGVRIAVEDPALVLSCSCPAFENEGPCKHLWATALAANERRLLAPLPFWTRVELDSSRVRRPSAPSSGDERRPPPPRIPAAGMGELFFPSGTGPSPLRQRPEPPPVAEILYVVEVEKTRQQGELTVSLRTRTARKKGGFAKDKTAGVPVQSLELLPDARDRRALPLLQAAATLTGSATGYQAYSFTYASERQFTSEARIPSAMASELMPLLSETGRLYMRPVSNAELLPVTYDGDPPWEFVVELSRNSDRGERARSRAPPARKAERPLVSAAADNNLRLGAVRAQRGPAASLRRVRDARLPARQREGHAPSADEEAFLARLYAQPTLPRLALPGDLSLEERTGTPEPNLKIGPPAPRTTMIWSRAAADRPTAELTFRYGGLPIAFADPRTVVASVSDRRLIRRDRDAEAAAAAKVLEAGFQRAPAHEGERLVPGRYDVSRPRLAGAVRTLVDAGWRVEAEGKLYRQAGTSPSRSQAASTGSISTARWTSAA